MTAVPTVLVEYATLTPGPLNTGPYLIQKMVGERALVLVPDADSDGVHDAIADEDRPVVPDPESSAPFYAFVIAIGGDVVVAWGTDPTADQTHGKLVLANTTELLPVRPGDRISLVGLDLDEAAA